MARSNVLRLSISCTPPTWRKDVWLHFTDLLVTDIDTGRSLDFNEITFSLDIQAYNTAKVESRDVFGHATLSFLLHGIELEGMATVTVNGTTTMRHLIVATKGQNPDVGMDIVITDVVTGFDLLATILSFSWSHASGKPPTLLVTLPDGKTPW